VVESRHLQAALGGCLRDVQHCPRQLGPESLSGEGCCTFVCLSFFLDSRIRLADSCPSILSYYEQILESLLDFLIPLFLLWYILSPYSGPHLLLYSVPSFTLLPVLPFSQLSIPNSSFARPPNPRSGSSFLDTSLASAWAKVPNRRSL
jgi:hypothetical protein